MGISGLRGLLCECQARSSYGSNLERCLYDHNVYILRASPPAAGPLQLFFLAWQLSALGPILSNRFHAWMITYSRICGLCSRLHGLGSRIRGLRGFCSRTNSSLGLLFMLGCSPTLGSLLVLSATWLGLSHPWLGHSDPGLALSDRWLGRSDPWLGLSDVWLGHADLWLGLSVLRTCWLAGLSGPLACWLVGLPARWLPGLLGLAMGPKAESTGSGRGKCCSRKHRVRPW